MLENFTPDMLWAIAKAADEALKTKARYVEPEHLLLGLLQGPWHQRDEVIDTPRIVNEVRVKITTNDGSSNELNPNVPRLSREVARVLVYADREAENSCTPRIGSGDVLLGILQEEQKSGMPSPIREVLGQYKVRLPPSHELPATRARIHPQTVFDFG